MDRDTSAMDVYLGLLAEAANDALDRLDCAREFAAKANAIKRDRSNWLSYLPRS